MSFEGDFSSPTGIQWNGHTGVVQYGSGDNLVVMFYNKSVHNPSKSIEAGRHVEEDRLYVRYHPPGERLNINDRPAHDGDKRRWPIQWAQFSKQLEQRPEGTPVEMLYPGKPSIARTLNAGGVFTVEQLATLSAHAIEQVGMGAQSWVNDAARYLEAANKGVKASQLKHELDERDSRIRTLELKLNQAMGEIERLRAGNSVDPGQMGNLQQMIANAVAAQMGQRPAMPHNPGPAFDVQTSQINNTSERVLPPRGPGRPRKVTT